MDDREIEEEKNPAHYCYGCNKYLGFRGYCSPKCYEGCYELEEGEYY